MKPEDALAALAHKQFGAFTREQATAAGLTKWAIYRRLGNHDWTTLQPDVFRLRGTPATWRQSVWAALRSLGDGAVASHGTAAFLWKLDEFGTFPPRRLDVTMPYGMQKERDGVRCHRSRQTIDRPALLEGLPVTPLPRTLVDLASFMEDRPLQRAFAAAVFRYKWALAAIEKHLAGEKFGCAGAEAIGRLVRKRRRSKTDGPFEFDALEEMRRFGTLEPSLQFVIRDPTGVVITQADFAWPALNVAMFTDGGEDHRKLHVFQKDTWQSMALAGMHWTVVRLHRGMLRDETWLENLGRVLDRQQRVIATLGPTP